MTAWFKRWVDGQRLKKAAIEQKQEEIKRDAKEFVARWAARCEEIEALTNDEATERFFRDLQAGAFVVDNVGMHANSRVSVSELPPTLRDLFSCFVRVTCVRSGYWIDQTEMEHADLGFLIVGSADEETILVRPPEEGIFTLDGIFRLKEKDLDASIVWRCLTGISYLDGEGI
jgi:hypothetical protein